MTGALCARLGAGLVAAASAVLVSVTVVLPGLAHTLPELAVALLAFGAATGTLNVAANSVGVRIEAAGDRTILPGLHAGFSLGGLGSGGVALASAVGYTGLLVGPPVIGLLIAAMGLPAALATVSVLAAVAAGLSLSVAPERDALTDRVADAFDAGRGWAVAGLTPAVVRYGPSVRRYADDLALLGPATGHNLDRRLTPESALAAV